MENERSFQCFVTVHMFAFDSDSLNSQTSFALTFKSVESEDIHGSLGSRKLSADFGEDTLKDVMFTCFHILDIDLGHKQRRKDNTHARYDNRVRIIGKMFTPSAQ